MERPIVKSRQRVSDHAEVFTPTWLVDEMLNTVAIEVRRVDSRILEPACGSGNFLIPILRRKLDGVIERFGRKTFEGEIFSLQSLMSLYGIDILEDNVQECRENLLKTFDEMISPGIASDLMQAARTVASVNIVHGDARSLLAITGKPLVFAEWSYLGKGKFQRRDFAFSSIVQRQLYGDGTLFADLDLGDILQAEKDDYPPLKISDIGSLSSQQRGEETGQSLSRADGK